MTKPAHRAGSSVSDRGPQAEQGDTLGHSLKLREELIPRTDLLWQPGPPPVSLMFLPHVSVLYP